MSEYMSWEVAANYKPVFRTFTLHIQKSANNDAGLILGLLVSGSTPLQESLKFDGLTSIITPIGIPFRVITYMGVSEIRGTLFWGPYNKDPTI